MDKKIVTVEVTPADFDGVAIHKAMADRVQCVPPAPLALFVRGARAISLF